MSGPSLHAEQERGDYRNRNVSRAIELAARGAELLADSNAVLRRIADISRRTMQANHYYAQMLLDWSHSKPAQHQSQQAHDRSAALAATRLIAQRAARAALDIAVLVDGQPLAWLHGIAPSRQGADSLADIAARIVALTAEVERLARRPAPQQFEINVLGRTLQGIRQVSQHNVEVGKRLAAGVEQIQCEALQFARLLG